MVMGVPAAAPDHEMGTVSPALTDEGQEVSWMPATMEAKAATEKTDLKNILTIYAFGVVIERLVGANAEKVGQMKSGSSRTSCA
jgi:hypothetical protein